MVTGQYRRGPRQERKRSDRTTLKSHSAPPQVRKSTPPPWPVLGAGASLFEMGLELR